MSPDCLNCATPIQQNYCPNCGQKATTHRYSIPHYIEHDLVHGIFHVDRGMLFTLKELFTRPGHGIREFIQGKRQNYFSFVSLILLILAASALLAPYVHVSIADVMPKDSKPMMNAVEDFMSKHPKLIIIITIPLYALLSYGWFVKAKLNFSEHLVLNSYRVIPELIINLLATALTVLFKSKGIFVFISLGLGSLLGLAYSIWFYYQFFSGYNYPKRMLVFNSIMVPASYVLLSVFVGIVSAIVQMVLAHSKG
jgi:hypothetical protein